MGDVNQYAFAHRNTLAHGIALALFHNPFGLTLQIIPRLLLALFVVVLFGLSFQPGLGLTFTLLSFPVVHGFSRTLKFVRSRGSEGGTEVALNGFDLTLTFLLILPYDARMAAPQT